MNPTHVKPRAVVIGHRVSASLQAAAVGRIIGVTSRGVFVQIASRVIFPTTERYRGPLTINLDRSLVVTNGERVRLSPTRLIFQAIEVDLSAAEVWQPAAPAIIRPIAAQCETLKQLVQAVRARKPLEGFGGLLPHLLDLPEKPVLSAADAALLARLNQLRSILQDATPASSFPQAAGGNPANQLSTLLVPLLGLGRGLTPSGDDVIIGLWLMLKRASSPRMNSRPDRENMLKQVAARLVTEAYRRTTTLSANLIECAADGEADERLITVVDGIMTGRPSLDDCASCVVEWGNSSGTDALIGMALAIAT